ncbi:hypothetical protein psyc5s11_51090 [Clostridium gelidum]|uniref:Cadherin-like beta-sandwich-like domain-containing protein n=1 Tax=Clostridium gelidum TaxID=704125 RepID=A0ABM7TAQ2_9CLOT|nr:cadherin-like beta sandwich domain-containing protein [Clostridium gelidum]BCZ49042.1 hypothetical protein psyc5s11_51090 [Clostridium gelidum]
MNKNLKRIMALVLVLGTVSAVAPATNFNILTTKAYASDDENDETTLKSLELKTSSNSTIRLYDDSDYDSDNKIDDDEVKDDGKYYAKTSSSKISIDIDGPSTKYVKVFKGTSSSTKGRSITEDISLSSGTNTFIVRVYYNKPDSNVRYDDGDVASEYTLKVKYTGSDSDSSTSTSTDKADSYDDIYLRKLSVESESIPLSDSKIVYAYNVASNIDEVTVKAEPDYDYYTVKIGGKEVDEDDKWKTTVSLKTGLNEFKIKIEDDDKNDERVYTLNITRGNTGTSNEASVTAGTTTTSKVSQWVQVNGRWQYNDDLGIAVKNSWFFDRTMGKRYFLQADGSMATGWLFNNGKWYYLGTNGAMNTGWIIDQGKYYYLNDDGSMAANTKIGLYKLGSDGAWIR